VSGRACCARRGDAALLSARRGRGAWQWLAPAAALALLPKCPACLAGYAALAGVGISVATASHLQVAVATLAAGWLAWLAIRFVRRLRRA
jgi:hypothetical protein